MIRNSNKNPYALEEEEEEEKEEEEEPPLNYPIRSNIE